MMNKVRFSAIFAALTLLFLTISPVHGAETAPQTETRPTPVIIEEISRLLSEFKYSDAIALFDTINPVDAAEPGIKLLKASVLNSAGKINEARSIAEGVSKAEPNDLDALFVLSAIEAAAGRTRQQKTLLERIIKIDPKNTGALTDLGNISLEAGQYQNAAKYFDEVLALLPQNLEALLGRAKVYRYQNNPKGAEELYNKAISIFPNEAIVWHNRARLYRGTGFPKEALADLDKARTLDPNDYWIAIDRGNVLLDMNQKAEALTNYKRAIEIDPDVFLAYVYSAGIKDDLGDIDGAGADYEILARLKPDYPYAFEGLGMHKMRDGQYEAAKNAFQETYRLLPEEWCYALLAAVNWMKLSNTNGIRPFLNQVMNKQKRDSMEYFLCRLYYDLSGKVYSGESDMVSKADLEKNELTKARLIFYLANYFDIKGNTTIADKYFLQFKEMDQRGIPEWRLNEWLLETRGIMPY
ncbi:MAG: tetratricopeptide repeat protein [Treponema sp.]|jgi:tetratricopeptide (TPR) repeat protein|nr:tetratricopeptide repeat protein [Treponema sp.]